MVTCLRELEPSNFYCIWLATWSVCVEPFQGCVANTVCVQVGNGWAGTCEFYVKEDLCLPKEKCDSLHLAMNLVDSVWRVHFSQYQVALCHYTLTCVCVCVL